MTNEEDATGPADARRKVHKRALPSSDKMDTMGDQLIEAVVPFRSPSDNTPDPLPMGSLLALPRDNSLIHRIAAIDSRGRISDQTIIQALEWAPKTTISIEISSSKVAVVRPNRSGVHALSKQGYLLLPAPMRRRMGLRARDRVFLVAAVHHKVLVLHNLSALDEMVLAYHSANLSAGEGK